jgi:four helix bundle protein
MENFKNNLITRATNLALEIIKFIDKLNKKDFAVTVIIKQLLRSITSVGANIIEAQARKIKKRFYQLLKSCIKVGK